MISVMLEKSAWKPGEQVKGTVTWHLDHAPRDLVVRLFWYTQGRGTEDLEIVDQLGIDSNQQGQMSFSLSIPEGPYTFSGKLISLIWAVECVARPSNECSREVLIVSPTETEIVLGEVS